MKRRGFQAKEVLELTGVTYRQLDYWSRTGIITPEENQNGGRMTRAFVFEDLVIIRVAAKLLDSGLNFQATKKAVVWLRELFRQNADGEFLLAVEGENLKLLTNNPGEIMDFIRGKCVLTIDVGQIIKQLIEKIEVLKRKSNTKRNVGTVKKAV